MLRETKAGFLITYELRCSTKRIKLTWKSTCSRDSRIFMWLLSRNDLSHSGAISTIKVLGKSQVFLYSKGQANRKRRLTIHQAFGVHLRVCPKEQPAVTCREPLQVYQQGTVVGSKVISHDHHVLISGTWKYVYVKGLFLM